MPQPAGRHRRPEPGRQPRASNERPRHPSGHPRRGRHAKAAEPLSFAALPIPAVRDAVRSWAIEAHRAATSLPVESWPLAGRDRQHALFTTLAATGLALVLVPVAQHADVNPLTDAGRANVSAGHAAHPAGAADRSARRAAPHPGRPAPAHAAPSAPAQPGPAAPDATPSPAVPVPPGTGPAQSLRTTGSTAVALTFDDGPDPVQTPKILALLAKYHVKATFCLIGVNVRAHPEVVRQIVAGGHTLCNHTWDHSLTIGQDSPEAIRADLDRTDAAIRDAAPGAKIPFFRAPGGNFTDRLVSVAYDEGMASLYWAIDPRDWDHTSDADDAAHTDRVVAAVRDAVAPGAIVLSHDYHQPDTVDAYERLLPYLTENYRIGRPVPPPPRSPSTAGPSSPAPANPAPPTAVEPLSPGAADPSVPGATAPPAAPAGS